MNDDVERQAPHGDTTGIGQDEENNARRASLCRFLCFMAAVAVVIIVSVGVPVQYFSVDTHYSVGIDSVSSIHPAPMGLSFNLTLAVTSGSYGAKSCVNPGMYVEIFYRGVQIARSEVETQRFCARPRKTAEMNVVARATGVPVGHVLDSLAAEISEGAAVFDIKLHVPASSYGGQDASTSWLTDCKGTRVGDAAVPCAPPYESYSSSNNISR